MTSGNTPVSSFMTGVASAGIELMSSNADYQNKLRTFESGLAQKQTKSQSLAVTNQANAIVKSGQAQADTYKAQAYQSFGGALCDGANFVRAGGLGSWGMDGKQAALQEETTSLAKEVDEHKKLLGDVDERLKSKRETGNQSATGTMGGPDNELSDEYKAALSHLDRNFSRRGEGGRNQTSINEENHILDLKYSTKETDSSGKVIPNKTKLDTYRKELQQKIDFKQESINSNQSQISNMIQQRRQTSEMTKELTGAASNMFLAGYANDKAQADADSTKWGFNKELGSNVFGAASQAMTDCNNQTDKMIDGITGALRHAVGG